MRSIPERSSETITLDFARGVFPSWFSSVNSTRSAVIVSYMHMHGLKMERCFGAVGAAKHFTVYRYASYREPDEVPGGAAVGCRWVTPADIASMTDLPEGFVKTGNPAVPVKQAVFHRKPAFGAFRREDFVRSRSFSGGDGTEQHPFLLSSAGDFLLLSYLSNHAEWHGVSPSLSRGFNGNFREWSRGKHFLVTRDIAFNDLQSPRWFENDPAAFPMIGNRNSESKEFYHFEGVLDGGGHFLGGLFITEETETARYPGAYLYSAGVSLFGNVGGVIRNLALVSCRFQGSGRVAAFAGCLGSGAVVDNCYADNRLVVSGTSGDRNGGGIAGFSVASTVTRCVVAGSVRGQVFTNVQFLGGIFGAVATGSEFASSVRDCFVFAKVGEVRVHARREYPIPLISYKQEEIAVLRVLTGVLNLKIGQNAYRGTEGDVFVINPYEYYQAAVSPQDCLVTSFQLFRFSPEALIPFPGSPLSAILSRNLREPVFENVLPRDVAASEEICGALGAAALSEPAPGEPSVPDALSELRFLSALYRFTAAMANAGLLVGLGNPKDTAENLKFKTAVIDYIEQNYRQELSTEMIAQVLFLNKSYFCRRFKETFGQPFLIYLQNFRIQKAKNLSPSDFASLTELAASVGFSSYYHFSRVFKKNTGLTPRSYFGTPSASDKR